MLNPRKPSQTISKTSPSGSERSWRARRGWRRDPWSPKSQNKVRRASLDCSHACLFCFVLFMTDEDFCSVYSSHFPWKQARRRWRHTCPPLQEREAGKWEGVCEAHGEWDQTHPLPHQEPGRQTAWAGWWQSRQVHRQGQVWEEEGVSAPLFFLHHSVFVLILDVSDNHSLMLHVLCIIYLVFAVQLQAR